MGREFIGGASIFEIAVEAVKAPAQSFRSPRRSMAAFQLGSRTLWGWRM